MLSFPYVLDVLLHLDQSLVTFVGDYGNWTYVVVAAVIFCETGLVVTPFLPGDSLLFALGALAARPEKPLSALVLLGLLVLAAFLGNQLNYLIGKSVGPHIFSKQRLRFINKKNLLKAHEFYETHGGATIIFARFMPVIRTFVPFVAGISEMRWTKFTIYNGVSAILWVASLLGAGYFFGSLPVIKDHFSLVVYGIVLVSLLPAVLSLLISKKTV